MTRQYLIGLSIGPVQDFIAAARRTRDLWFGSYVLSEVSKAAALQFSHFHSELIFPAPESNLLPDSKETPNKSNVGNKILVLVQTDDPQSVLNAAKEAALQRWEILSGQCHEKICAKTTLNEDIWEVQVKDVLEFFGAWVCLENDQDYAAPSSQNKGLKRLDKLLNARKNTREFLPNAVLCGSAIAKSSLDGLRESVLTTNMKLWQKRSLGLQDGEALDCIGVVKRLGGDIDQFTPLSRLAIDPWLRNPEVNKTDRSEILEIFQALKQTDFDLVSSVLGNQHIYSDFCFDGQLLYDFRIQAELNKLAQLGKKADKQSLKTINEATQLLKNLQQLLTSTAFKDLPKPLPYMAILAADGDQIGKLLTHMRQSKQHQAISAKLAEFSTQVPGTIRDQFRGHCIYAGGDDVLALLPLDTAIQCAQQLATDFKQILATLPGIPVDIKPTLSVGLGVSHFLTPLNKQLDLARRAEQLAKSNDKPDKECKNALAILLQPRSGAEISFRERWDSLSPPAEILGKWMMAHNHNLLPKRFGYELRETSFALNWCTSTAHELLIEQEVGRILDRKRTTEGQSLDEQLIADICQRAAQIGLSRLANELIITHRFAEVHQLSNAPVPNGENKHD